MSFDWPIALLGLAVLPPLVAIYIMRERSRVDDAASFVSPALLPNLIDRKPGWRRHLPLALMLVALAALIVGVGRPRADVKVRREEATVMLVIDTSRSMGAADVKPTRLAAAQAAAYSLLDKVPKKFRVGVIAFGSRAVVALPPTDNRELTRTAIGLLHTGEGTALGDAIVLAATVGQRQRTADGAVPPTSVLVISDGAADGGRVKPLDAAKRAKKLKVPVYTAVLGTPNGTVQHQLTGGYTETIRVPPSPSTLRQIASITGGQFSTATTDASLRKVYSALGSRLGHKTVSREMTDVFAGGSALLLLVGGTLSAFWFRRVP
ncbi:MAG: Ca-activated chloride channel [Gaiellaceae bacterium]|nr:Ca-activated chloride channel [Gaiellaceae bacterium]